MRKAACHIKRVHAYEGGLAQPNFSTEKRKGEALAMWNAVAERSDDTRFLLQVRKPMLLPLYFQKRRRRFALPTHSIKACAVRPKMQLRSILRKRKAPFPFPRKAPQILKVTRYCVAGATTR